MTRTVRTVGIVTLTSSLLAAGALLATPASARDGDVVVRKACGSVAQKLKLSLEDGGTEVEYELDQNRAGRVWDVRVTRNGSTVASVARTTRAPSGSFEVRTLGAAGGTWRVVAIQRGAGTRCTIAASG